MQLSLMYHNFVRDPAEARSFPRDHRRYVLTQAQFLFHIEAISKLGWLFIAPQEAASHAAGEDRRILLTFDDSWEGHEWTAQRLSARGIKGVFFLNSGALGMPNMLTAAAARNIAALGHEIGSHGVDHSFFTDLDDPALGASLIDSKAYLESTCGTTVRFVSFPGGRFDRRIREFAPKTGYLRAFSSRPGPLLIGGGDFVLNRVAVTADIDAHELRALLTRPAVGITLRALRYNLGRARFCVKSAVRGVLGRQRS